MMDRVHDQLASLVDAVKASAKYRDVSQELIARIAAQELSKGRSEKDAIKATKNKLHQVGGAYLDKKEHYSRWLDDLKMAVRTGQRERLLELSSTIMSHHASTRERIPILEQFYTQIFRELPPIRSILDIACGLNPLAIPWMPPFSPADFSRRDSGVAGLDTKPPPFSPADFSRRDSGVAGLDTKPPPFSPADFSRRDSGVAGLDTKPPPFSPADFSRRDSDVAGLDTKPPLSEKGIEYFAYDIYHGMMDFLQAWFEIMHIGGNAQVCDVIQTCPTQPVDVAFLLKVVPCLEQLDKMAGHRLLRELHAANLVVSFPIHSLGGRSKGMLEHYETHFQELLGNEPRWEVKRLIFSTELVFVVRK
jgi:Ribosomal RNA methyltransferase (FmrO)